MGLEAATFISGLNASNPVHATDPVSDGDDHIRLIKSTLLNTFPNIAGAMNATHTELNNLVGVTGKTGTGNLVLSAAPTFTGTILAAAITASGLISGSFSGDGAALTGLPAGAIGSGTFADGRIAASNVTQHAGAIDHDSLLNFVANEHINHASVSITAGSGLTGGGTIAASRTLSVGAGSGISVTADAVAVDSSVARTTGDTFTGDIVMSGTRSIDATTRLNLTGAVVSVGENGGDLGFFGSAGGAKPHFSIGSDTIVDLAAALNSLGLISTGP